MCPSLSICRGFATLLLLLLTVDSRGEGVGVVINEIMYHPPDDLDTLQFIELFNTSEAEVDLSGWSFSRGIKFVFPSGTRLRAGSFLVVCRKHADFADHYGSGVPAVGDFDGKLKHSGERLELIDSRKQLIDAVTYSDHAPWPLSADGGSASLERICPQAGADVSNWAPSRLPGVVRPAGSPGRTNDCFSAKVLPAIVDVTLAPENPAPDQPVTVRVTVAAPDGVKTVKLLYRVVAGGRLSEETALLMRRVSGDERHGRFETEIPAQPASRLVRYRLWAVDQAGSERVVPSNNDLRPALSYSTFVNTNRALIPFGFVLHPVGEDPRPPGRDGARLGRMNLTPVRRHDAFIYLPPEGGAVQAFDYVRVTPRKGGFKVRFLKDRALRGMTTVNVIFEDEPRRVLSEPLAYELYRLAGVPAELTEHIRVWVDGRLVGYHLLLEQPNKSFLHRNGRDDTGNLYKLIWYGQDLIGKHEKKTNLASGHDDLVAVVRGLKEKTPARQWEFIERNFNVTNFINYYAVNMCIQNWDGFFNNYFTYHDAGGTGRWEIYPWDEDKTWGDYDGASSRYDWYTMPLSFGMNGGGSAESRKGRGFWGGGFEGWHRPPGVFSGPLLANPEFRPRFLARLREICQTIFTEARMFPIIDALEKRLAPEIAVRVGSLEAQQAQTEFRADIESFRRQVTNRRKFILSELDKVAR